MIVVPRWFSVGLASAIAVYAVAFGLLSVAAGRSSALNLVALGLFGLGFALCVLRTGRMSVLHTAVAVGCGAALPLLASVGLDPVHESYSSGGWYVSGVGCIAVVLVWRRRAAFAWGLLGVLVLHTALWGGVDALYGFGVIAAVLLMAVMAAGGWAVVRTERDLARYSAAEREALEWEAAQEAYHRERQGRLATTSQLASGMLQRIAAATDGLTDADRIECRVLEQTIRDEIRGRRLLNDAVRQQVVAHRRRGAVVQVNDDGGIDDVDVDDMQPLLDRVAAELARIRSDRIIIRTAPRDSDKALSVVAMSSDPLAAALGIDGEDDRVDLWLELDRPVVA